MLTAVNSESEAGSRIPAHSRTSVRTLIIAISGFGAAALVTSLSVLLVNDFEPAVRVAVIGGTLILGISAAIVGLCTLGLPAREDYLPWGAAALALGFTTMGSMLRAGGFVTSWRLPSEEVAQGVYVVGLLLLLISAVSWPLLNRNGRGLGAPFAAAAASTAALGLLFWTLAGSDVVHAAYREGEPIGPVQMRQFLALMAVMTLAAAFSLASAVYLRGDPRTVPQMLLAAGMLAMIAGDVDWLIRVSTSGWSPGALGDFTHLAGHVIIATGASLALDVGRALSAESQGT